jgi:hypothetical protein
MRLLARSPTLSAIGPLGWLEKRPSASLLARHVFIEKSLCPTNKPNEICCDNRA